MDVSTRAWTVTYEAAVKTALIAKVEGVDIPYVDRQTLIASKQTYRDQDRVDIQRLLEAEN